MKAEIKQLEDLVRELSVEVPAETVNAKMEQKLQDVRRTASLKGFRKGKAPMNMIRSLYSDQVKLDVAEEIIKSTYVEVVKENTLKVASYPEVKELKYEDDGRFTYVATVEVFPEIEKVDFDGLTLTAEEIKVEDAEVDEVVEALRKRHSELRVVNRPATDEDTVVMDIEVLSDPGKVLETDRFEKSEVDLANKLTVKEFKEQIPGLSEGESKEIEVAYDDDYPDKVFAGARLTYKATVRTVKERLLPIANDDFARTTQQGETMLELRMKIREQLTQQKTDERNRGFKNQVIQQVCERNEVPIPKAMVGEYLNNVVQNFKNQYGEVDEVEIRKNYEQAGVVNIRWNMLMHHIANQEKIEVLQADTENLINRFAENYQTTPDKAREAITKSGNIADLKESILEDKVIDFLVDKATISEVKK